jgi:hypothetical protein
MNLSRMAVPCWFQYNSPVCFPQDPRPFLRVFGWARWGPYSGHSPPLHTDDVAAQTILASRHSSWGGSMILGSGLTGGPMNTDCEAEARRAARSTAWRGPRRWASRRCARRSDHGIFGHRGRCAGCYGRFHHPSIVDPRFPAPFVTVPKGAD